VGRRARTRESKEASDKQTPQQVAKERASGAPLAPWGSAPLTEIAVLLALVTLVAGFFVGGSTGIKVMMVGLGLGSLAGLELTLREHLAGKRSYAPTLAGLVAMVAATAAFAVEVSRPIMVAVGIGVFIAAYGYFNYLFQSRSDQ